MVGRVFNYNSYYSMLVCANCGHLALAWPIRTAAGWAAGASIEEKPGPATTPPTPGWRKNRGRVPGPGRLYFSAIQNHLLRTGGGYRKNRGA